MKHSAFLDSIPDMCRGVEIMPRHKIALQPFFSNDGVMVVLLTDMPGDYDKFWSLSWQQWREIEPKHETKLRWIREHIEPSIVGVRNPPKFRQPLLF